MALGGTQVLVTGDNVNVRSRPSLDGEVLTQVSTGTILSSLDNFEATKPATGHTASWARVQLPAAVPVWVHSSYVQADTVRADHLNLRDGPGENYGILGQLNAGDKVKVRARKGNWIQVEAPAQAQAFVARNYLKPVPPSSLASATPATVVVSSQVEPPRLTKPAIAVSTPTVAAAVPLPSLGNSDRNSQPRTEVLPNRARIEPTVASLAPTLLSGPAKTDSPVQTAPATARSLPQPSTPVSPPAPILSEPVEKASPSPIPEVAASAPAGTAVAAGKPENAGNAPEITPAQVSVPSIRLAKAEETRAPDKATEAAAPEPPRSEPDSLADGRYKLELPPPTPKNEFSVGYFLTWNTSAHFQNSGGLLFPAPSRGSIQRRLRPPKLAWQH